MNLLASTLKAANLRFPRINETDLQSTNLQVYRVAQLDLIPEIKVLYMLFNRCNIDITKKYPKQHTQYFNFRCKIQLGHPVLVPVAHKLQFRSNFGDGAPLKCRNDMNMGIIKGIIHNSIFRTRLKKMLKVTQKNTGF